MKTVIITGASRGIGKALAEQFLNNQFFVIGTSTNGTVPIEHPNLTPLQLDLADPKSIEKCAEEIQKLGKGIDILINNAGIWAGDFDERGEELKDGRINIAWLRQTLEVNLIGTTDFTERIIPLMQDGGHIVNISSRAGSMGYAKHANYPDYKISKAALNMLTKALSLRLAGKITVSSVHPGWVKTDMGGADADITPEEAAKPIFTLATSQVETGQFWFNGEKFPW